MKHVRSYLLFAVSIGVSVLLAGCVCESGSAPGTVSSPQPRLAKLHDFGAEGDASGTGMSRLTLVGSTFYGMSYFGGRYGLGTVFAMDLDGQVTVLHSFGGKADATYAYYETGPVYADGWLYGSAGGGSSSELGETPGVVFRIRPNGTDYRILYTAPRGNVAPISCVYKDWVYACLRGKSERSIFRIRPDGSEFTTLHTFTNPSIPTFAPLLVPSSWFRSARLIGAVQNGGTRGRGMIYRMRLDGSGFTVLHEFTGSDGLAGGSEPLDYYRVTMMSSDGVLYGTVYSGGAAGKGTLWKFADEEFALLHEFKGADGTGPAGQLLMFQGVLYGTTNEGGSQNNGVVFSILPDGKHFNVLQEFDTRTGMTTCAGLAACRDKLYGTTYRGGRYGHLHHWGGTAFAVTP